MTAGLFVIVLSESLEVILAEREVMHTSFTVVATLSFTLFSAQFAGVALAQTEHDTLDRTSLPIAEPDYPHSTVLDARDATAPPRFEIKPPAGAPNVLIVLVDDMGFGMPSAFGGPVQMPSAETPMNDTPFICISPISKTLRTCSRDA